MVLHICVCAHEVTYYVIVKCACIGGSELPWGKCEDEWSTKECFMPEVALLCTQQNMTYFKRDCLNSTQVATMGLTAENFTAVLRKPPAEEYFK